MLSTRPSRQLPRLLGRLLLPAAAILLLLAAGLWLAFGGGLRQALPQAQRAPANTQPANLDSAAAYYARANDEFDAEAYEASIVDYGRAIELQPDFPEAFNNRAYTYMKLENYALALPDLDEAIRLRPDYVNALINRGDIYNYYYQIDRDRAIEDYNRALELDPGNVTACGHRDVAAHNGVTPGMYLNYLMGHNGDNC